MGKKYNRELLDFRRFIEKYPKDDIKMRSEGSLSIFFKDRSFLDKLIAKWPGMISEFWKPANEQALEHMLSNVRVEVKDYLTYDCRYKVYLTNGLKNITEENRKSFLKLCKKNPDHFIIGPSTKLCLERGYRFFGSNYFYIKDSKYLLMAQMLIQPLIKETVKMVTLEEIEQNGDKNAQ